MFDADSVALIARAPSLPGLDLKTLPQELTKAYTAIVASRFRLQVGREAGALPEDLRAEIERLRRIAAVQEARVASMPDRPDRAAAAFVAGTAHQAVHMAAALHPDAADPDTLRVSAIPATVAATLLFLVAERPAAAAEMARQIRLDGAAVVERALLVAIANLAAGRLGGVLGSPVPALLDPDADAAELAVRSLWWRLLDGVRALAARLLGDMGLQENLREPEEAGRIFKAVAEDSVEPMGRLLGDHGPEVNSVLTGPRHLATLLLAVATDMVPVALADTPPPNGIDAERWAAFTRRLAERRPYLWPNHRGAIAEGYLTPGISAAVSFPTGGGKSTLSELKIATALLRGHKVIYLAPTLALVDQVHEDVQISFPSEVVQREAPEDGGFSQLDIEELPSVAVMTPERCLALLGFSPQIFDEVGLLVFDECHLIHPKGHGDDRRAVDGMLCLLRFMDTAPQADILMMSAMMGNAGEIAAWLEEITARPCLALTMEWKPTRQARGCVVFDAAQVRELDRAVARAYAARSTKTPPTKLQRLLSAHPLGFFCLRQTWQTVDARDYALLKLSEDPVQLSASAKGRGRWSLDPNRYVVASELAANAGRCGMKTLVFAQTVNTCNSTAARIARSLGPRSDDLTSREATLLAVATEEVGARENLYFDPAASAVPHHGLLTQAERQLHESLFRRRGGVDVLVATSTLAQGMNLPTELVIIAGDDRFDPGAEAATQLEAHELLNAAGRAGRAGEAAQGMVIVVPSRIIGLDGDAKSIGQRWFDLRAIFSKSDQCLAIQDPLEHILDRIHLTASAETGLEGYVLTRLAASGDGDGAHARRLIGRTFGASRARRRGDVAWVERVTESALALRGAAAADRPPSWHDGLAASCGLPVDLVHDLDRDLHMYGHELDGSVADWIEWYLAWLRTNPRWFCDLVRPSSLSRTFGQGIDRLDIAERASHTTRILETMLPMWVGGAPLREIERALGAKPGSEGKCTQARGFALRLVPELGYAFGVLSQVHRRAVLEDATGHNVPLVLVELGQLIRDGFDDPEKLALHRITKAPKGRVVTHQTYREIDKFINQGERSEDFAETIRRVSDGYEIWSMLQ
jgi:superfamily II DNA/RNA helicase